MPVPHTLGVASSVYMPFYKFLNLYGCKLPKYRVGRIEVLDPLIFYSRNAALLAKCRCPFNETKPSTLHARQEYKREATDCSCERDLNWRASFELPRQ